MGEKKENCHFGICTFVAWSLFGLVAGALGSPDAVRVTAVAGGPAELPCDTTPPPGGPAAMLVVWYRDDVPVYSWDGRRAGGSHWAAAELAGRARWAARPARLALQAARARDAGRYRCRAEFRHAPSKATAVDLVVVEPSSAPRIFDEEGREIIGKAAPYREGDTPVFSCVVTGGSPPPTVQWYRDDEPIAHDQTDFHNNQGFSQLEDDISHELIEHGVQKRSPYLSDATKVGRLSLKPIGWPLRLPSLKRADLLATFSCKANNSKLLPTLSTTITLDMQLSPMTVEVEAREPLRAGRRETLTCRARGARPPATLSWLLQGAPLPPHSYRQEESEIGDVSTSTLELVVGRDQRGQQLTCKATHILLAPSAPLLSVLTLDVLLPPDVNLRLGRENNLQNLRENDSVLLDCAVLAHPPPYKISWEHNGRTIAHDPVAGVEIEWGRLSFPSIQRVDSGPYNCIASNVEGDTRSNTLNLQVMYPPVCRVYRDNQKLKVSNRKRAELLCEVEANPAPINFTWALNTSTGLQPIAQEHFVWSGLTSKLKHPQPGKKDGEALCWASNKMGSQAMPCIVSFQTPRPSPPLHCTLHNLTTSDFSLLCEPGEDSELAQAYELTVTSSSDDKILANMTTSYPVFRIDGLPSGKELKLLLFSIGSESRSEPVELFIIMPHTPSKYKGNHNSIQTVLLLGITFGTLLLFLLAIMFMKCKDRLFQHYTPAFKSGQVTNRAREEECSTVVHEDRNPDVVPLNKEISVEQNGTVLMRAEEEWEVARRSPRLQEEFPPATQPLVSEMVGSWSVRALHGHEVVTSRTPLPVTQESCV